ncbi:CDP-alcohol phosphatidyltransferase family protein [Candidatus Parcubacteria bacterium]|jgi:CDP-diacylglycerol--glycerol-3-phosphate 3-phosphatidyltransferase|nr:MAG: CDP-alcohol phosphatidyltransferase family protein [Candidatus Parcubacteria bacterium]
MIRNFNLPNLLSILRMLAVIPIWLLNHNQSPWAFWVYLLALLTDYFDGATARWLKSVTDVGKLLDPLADKILHLFLLFQFQRIYPEIEKQFVWILVLALILAALPGIVALFKVKRKLGSNFFGKAKMACEGAALILLFLGQPGSAGKILWLAVALAIASILGHLLLRENIDYRWWRKAHN